MAELEIPIIKGTDRQYFDLLKIISESNGANSNSLTKQWMVRFPLATESENFEIDKLIANTTFCEILAANVRSITDLRIGNNQNYVAILRNQPPRTNKLENFDTLRIQFDKPTRETSTLVSCVYKALEEFCPQEISQQLTDSEERAATHRSQSILELKSILVDSTREFDVLRRTHYEDIDKLRKKLLDDHESLTASSKQLLEEKYKELESDRETLRKDIEAFALEKQKFDNRPPTDVRRELQDKFLKKIKERQENFALSPNTGSRRIAVLSAYIVFLVITSAMVGTLIYFEVRNQSEVNYWLVGTRIAGSVLFFTTFAFLISWLNRWATVNADEEFKSLQADLDMHRAAWLIEAVLESKDTGNKEVLEELIAKLSAGLFLTSQESSGVSTSLGDAIIKTVGNVGDVELTTPGTAIRISKKRFRRTPKP